MFHESDTGRPELVGAGLPVEVQPVPHGVEPLSATTRIHQRREDAEPPQGAIGYRSGLNRPWKPAEVPGKGTSTGPAFLSAVFESWLKAYKERYCAQCSASELPGADGAEADEDIGADLRPGPGPPFRGLGQYLPEPGVGVRDRPGVGLGELAGDVLREWGGEGDAGVVDAVALLLSC